MGTEGTVEEAKAAGPAMAAYATAHGLMYYQSWSLPEPTQLMRHGFMQEVPNLVRGTMPGLGDTWLAHADYAYTGHTDIERRFFTLVYVPAPASEPYAVRVLCHDRDLTKLDVSNPDADRDVVELDDRAVRLESDEFLRRYTLSTDHDQDELRVWQLFDPDLVDWLTRSAPPDFSFELQDGALCCFVPGVIVDAAALDALCAASARVFKRVGELSGGVEAAGTPGAPPAPGTRDDIVERELAAHPFTSPPDSVKAAAKAFGHGPLRGDRAWKLGAEAFFRSYAESIGLKPLDPGAYRASHLEVSVPGALTDVATGHLRVADLDAYLLLTSDEDYDDLGWTAIVVDLPPGSNGYAFAVLPEADAAGKHGFDFSSNGRSLMLWKPDKGPRKRSRKELDEFLARAEPLLAKVIAAGRPE